MKKHGLALAVAFVVAATSSLSALTINDKYVGDIEVGTEFVVPFEMFKGKESENNFMPLQKKYIQLGAGFNVNYFYNIIGVMMDFDWGFTAKHPDEIDGIKLDKSNVNSFYFKLAPVVKILNHEGLVIKAHAGIAFGNLSVSGEVGNVKTKVSTPMFIGAGAGAEMDFNFNKMFYLSAGLDLNFMFFGKSKFTSNISEAVPDSKEKIMKNGILLMPKLGVGFRF